MRKEVRENIKKHITIVKEQYQTKINELKDFVKILRNENKTIKDKDIKEFNKKKIKELREEINQLENQMKIQVIRTKQLYKKF